MLARLASQAVILWYLNGGVAGLLSRQMGVTAGLSGRPSPLTPPARYPERHVPTQGFRQNVRQVRKAG